MRMDNHTDLSTFNNDWYNPGASKVKIIFWLLINALFFRNPLNLSSGIKVKLLKLFGAQIGSGVLIKPSVNIKYPWKLIIGNNCWIGENVWIDNLANVEIKNNVCLSQGSMLLTGNHNYKKPSFDLMIGEIVLDDGVWIGAKSIVCPGITCHSHAVLAVASIATSNMEPFTIYQGNPAVKLKTRTISDV